MGSTWVDKPGLKPGLALPIHIAVNHCIRVASYNVKRWHLESGSSVLSFFSLSCGCKVGVQHVGTYVRLTMDMAWEARNCRH